MDEEEKALLKKVSKQLENMNACLVLLTDALLYGPEELEDELVGERPQPPERDDFPSMFN